MTFAGVFSDALHPPDEVTKGVHGRRRRGVTWLRNVRVKHVSIVGKGANRRTFTVIKADTDDPFVRLERALCEWLAATN